MKPSLACLRWKVNLLTPGFECRPEVLEMLLPTILERFAWLHPRETRSGAGLNQSRLCPRSAILYPRLASVISRNNQARAQAHCRSIVLGETPRAAAVSGTVMPAK